MKRKELFLMLIPCLIFAGVALWQRAREANLPPDDGFFHLIIEKIEMRPIAAKDVADGYDTQVVATLNHSGPTPDWWGKQSGNYGSSDTKARLFYEDKNLKRAVRLPPDFTAEPNIFYWRPSWKTDTKRYEARFFLQLSKLPPRAEKTVLRAPLIIENSDIWPHQDLSKAAPLVFTVREAKQVVKTPNVARDPLLRLIKAEIIKPTAAQQKASGGFDTEINVHLQDLGPNDATASASGGDSIVDENDTPIANNGGYSSGSRGSGRRPVLHFECSLSRIAKSQRHVFVKMKFSRGDRWPLIVRVPIRQNGKDLKGRVQATAQPMKPTP